MSTAQVYALGPFEIRCDGQPLPKPPTLKSQSLLAYLLLHRDRPQPRDRLIGLFWADRPEDKARNSLSTALWHIRRALPESLAVRADAQTVQIAPQGDLWLDVEAFEALAASKESHRLEEAAGLARGDFLEGLLDDWVLGERHRLQALLCEVLAQLVQAYEAQEQHEAALETAQRLLAQDPLREDAHRAVMRAYARLGRRNAALEQYQRGTEILRQELGVEPTARTRALYQAILEERLGPEPAPAARSAAPRRGAGPGAGAPSAHTGRNPLDVAVSTPFVGREEELAFLEACWKEVQQGAGGLVLLAGEAGLGKSRLVEEWANQLRRNGVRVLWGRCYEFERVLPYQPVVEALRTILPAGPPSLPGWMAAEIARLLPEFAKGPSPAEATTTTRPDQERARLFEALQSWLAMLAGQGPLLVVLEDLHWATGSTLNLVHYLARHLARQPVLLIGTLRPEVVGPHHPLAALQRRLSRERFARTLRLAPLSSAATESLVAQMSGAGAAVQPLARRLYRETEGNAFFLVELVKALFEASLVHLAEGVWQGDFQRICAAEWPLPRSVSEVIQARVGHLKEDAHDALRLAAVLGREFDFELFRAAWGQDEEAALEALEDLLRHRLIEEGTGTLGRDYAFAHTMVREVVYAEMPRRRRYRLHTRAGLALEQLHGDQAAALAGELAHHFLQGQKADPTLSEKAVRYLLLAGDQARGLYAHGEAIAHYEQALAFLQGPEEYERAARTRFKLGLTCHLAADFTRARQSYEEGFALWQKAGERPAGALPPAPHPLRVAWTDPFTLDPALAGDVGSACVIDQLFSGLVELGPDLEIVPAAARTWEVLDGGRGYRFHLRDDWRWSDGTPVTAGDFACAWLRVLDPRQGSPSASLLYDIRGARAWHEGEWTDPGGVGVQAVDDATLVVELEGPASYFPHLLAYYPTYPVPRHTVEQHGTAWTQVDRIVTDGPFRLAAWQHGAELVLERAPYYCGRARGNVQRVELSLLSDPVQQLARYEEGALDILNLWSLPLAERNWARQHYADAYVSGPLLGTMFVGFDVSRPPFDDPHVRQALVLATDRERLAGLFLEGYEFPATGGFVPPGMPGHSAGIGLPYDVAQAQELLAAAGYPAGHGFPALDALTSHSLGPLGLYLAEQWQNTLHIEIRWERLKWADFLENLYRRSLNLFLVGWLAPYPDPDNFLRMSPAWSHTRWRSEAYVRLVEQARGTPDQVERMRLYQEADRILVEEAVVLPLTYRRMHLLVKPWVSRYPTSAIKQWFWKDVVIGER
jgi:ABC-type oligopeptide transport system substrate-binding subunit/DNA-binding SARP family transcriptional activator